MKGSKFHIICLFVVVVIMTSFIAATTDKETLFQEALTKRLEDYKQELLDTCKEEAIEEAEAKVDSIISVELGAGPIDTVSFPRKPQKPLFESFDSLDNGQLEIKPLFDKNSTTVDSL